MLVKRVQLLRKFLNNISETLTSKIGLTFANETFKELIAKNKINDKFKIIVEPENENLNQPTD